MPRRAPTTPVQGEDHQKVHARLRPHYARAPQNSHGHGRSASAPPGRRPPRGALGGAVKERKVWEKTRRRGVEPGGMATAEADAFFEQELVRWKTGIDPAGIKLEH